MLSSTFINVTFRVTKSTLLSQRSGANTMNTVCVYAYVNTNIKSFLRNADNYFNVVVCLPIFFGFLILNEEIVFLTKNYQKNNDELNNQMMETVEMPNHKKNFFKTIKVNL